MVRRHRRADRGWPEGCPGDLPPAWRGEARAGRQGLARVLPRAPALRVPGVVTRGRTRGGVVVRGASRRDDAGHQRAPTGPVEVPDQPRAGAVRVLVVTEHGYRGGPRRRDAG